MFVEFTHAGRAALDVAIPHAPANLAPLLTAVRDHGLAFTMVAQSRQRFKVPDDGPAVVMIGDDLANRLAMGPPGFHVRSLRRLFARARVIAVMSGAPVAEMYDRMAREAVTHKTVVVVIETQVSHEGEWSEFIADAAPSADAHLVSPTVAGWQQ